MSLIKCTCTLIVLVLLLGIDLNAQSNRSKVSSALLNNSQGPALKVNDIDDYEVTHSHVSSLSGIEHVYVRQTIGGIPVHNATGSIHFKKDGTLLKSDQKFISGASQLTNRQLPGISAFNAITSVSKKLGYPTPKNVNNTQRVGRSSDNHLFSKGNISKSDIPAKLIYYQNKDNELRLSWEISIQEISGENWWNMLVDAHTGEILNKDNWTVKCSFGHHSDKEHDHTCNHQIEPSNAKKKSGFNPDSYNVYPIGIESPIHGNRSLVINPADALASPYGWHDTDGVIGAEYTITRGNNVHVTEDYNGDDSSSGFGYSPNGSSSLHFDYPLDFTQDPSSPDVRDASLTNLFYWNNIMHDVWYQYGFDEASGNFQSNNYGNPGADNDYVVADGQDGGGANNANFSTPPDGGNGHMQLYLWSGSNNNFDVNSPTNIQGNYDISTAGFGPINFNTSGDLVLAEDNSANPNEACNLLTNAADLDGNIAMIDRGSCEFGTKALNAQNAGAIAVLICNNVAGAPINMAAGDDGLSVNIPTVMLSQSDCNLIKAELPDVNVSFSAFGIDSDFDSGVISHEYGHGISIRLTGGAANSGCLIVDEQMGEGWSDWFALMMTTSSSDLGADSHPMGNFILNEPTTGNGIRPFPYSTNMSINPHTYDDIKTLSIPYGPGIVWCAMLWELTWNLVDIYGWDDDYYTGDGGNNMAMALVIEALKLQPCNPGFIDARDAILLADQVLYNGIHQCEIWKAFAKRGLGYYANQGIVYSVTDGIENFDLPISCSIAMEKVSDSPTAAEGDTITYTLTVQNNSPETVTNVLVSDVITTGTSYVAGSATQSGYETNGTAFFPITSMSVGQIETMSFSVVLDAGQVSGNYTISDDIESGNNYWTLDLTNPPQGGWSIVNTNPHMGTSHWYAQDDTTSNDQSLIISNPIIPSSSSQLKFFHYYDTEVDWDGGLVQISANGGLSWTDLGPNMSQNGYNGIIDNDPNMPAFSGLSNSYIETIIELGSFVNQSVVIRFWMHCDAFVGGDGWYIDDIGVTDLILGIPNTAEVISDQGYSGKAFLQQATIIDNCPNYRHINSIVTSNTFEASNLISSDGLVPQNEIVDFKANEILLEPIFEVETGATFLAEIDPCQ